MGLGTSGPAAGPASDQRRRHAPRGRMARWRQGPGSSSTSPASPPILFDETTAAPDVDSWIEYVRSKARGWRVTGFDLAEPAPGAGGCRRGRARRSRKCGGSHQNFTGRASSPRTVRPGRQRSSSVASCSPGKRLNNAGMATDTSRRARCAPRHMWGMTRPCNSISSRVTRPTSCSGQSKRSNSSIAVSISSVLYSSPRMSRRT